jgi:hypothetical protein
MFKKLLKHYDYYSSAKKRVSDPRYQEFLRLLKRNSENSKLLNRTKLINILLNLFSRESKYLEIGVRDPNHNFNLIQSKHKISVDPGIEFVNNPVDFKMTSDEYFNLLNISNSNIKFDLIFVDGLHEAEQVDRDIINGISRLNDDGFLVLHDCNPFVESLQRDDYYNFLTESGGLWNGTVWKSFVNYRYNTDLLTFCIDSDYGLGVICNRKNSYFNDLDIPAKLTRRGQYYNYSDLQKNRPELLGLISVNDFLIYCEKKY